MVKSRSIDVIKLQRNMMLLTGIWPVESPTVFYKFKELLSWFMSFTFVATMIMELIKHFHNYEALFDIISLLLSPLSYCFKLVIFKSNEKHFLELIQHINQKMFTSYPEKLDIYMQKAIKRSNTIATIFQRFCAGFIMLYSLRPLFISTGPYAHLPVRFSYELGNFIYPMYVYQVLGLAIAAWNNSCMDILAAGVMSIASAQFLIVSEKLGNSRNWAGLTEKEINLGITITTTEISESIDLYTRNNIRECVQHHEAILRSEKFNC